MLVENIFTTLATKHRGNLCRHLVSTLGEFMSGLHDLGECLSLDGDDLPSAVYLSIVETQPPSNDCNLMFLRIGGSVGDLGCCGGWIVEVGW